MFTMKVIDSDAFLDMPLSAQALYFHLNMRADDDGFVNNPKRILRTVGAAEDDMRLLIVKRFVIGFDRGVIVIKHWRMHNTLKKDRYNPTQYQEELQMLSLKPNKSYTENPTGNQAPTTWQPTGTKMEPNWNQNGTKVETQYSIGKDSIEEISIGEENKPARNKYGQYKNVLLSDEDMDKLKTEFPQDWENRIERLSEYIASSGKSYKNHLATIRSWARKDKQKDKRTVQEQIDDLEEFIRRGGI